MGQEELNYYTYNSKPEKKYLQISTNISMSHAELNYHTNNNKPEKIYVHKICVALMPKQQQYFDRSNIFNTLENGRPIGRLFLGHGRALRALGQK